VIVFFRSYTQLISDEKYNYFLTIKSGCLEWFKIVVIDINKYVYSVIVQILKAISLNLCQ